MKSTSYTLYLTTNSIPENLYVSPINNANLANVSWNVNWDGLFNNTQNQYKFCRLRYHFVSQFKPDATIWDNYLGYLSCNLASDFNATTTNGTILGLLYYQFRIRYNTLTGAVLNCAEFDLNTFDTLGININIPTGVSIFNIQMLNDDSFNPFIQQTQNYQILLQFELYNE